MDGRIRLRQWLEARLNGGQIPGLVWLDRQRAIFKIPWKHHSKHTWHEDDAAIFKDWAVVTGRYREGVDAPDWPMWKTRLRCALNKAPDIQEVRQRHELHCEDPFKAYRFISKTECVWRAHASSHASLIFDGAGAGAGAPPPATVPPASVGSSGHNMTAGGAREVPSFHPGPLAQPQLAHVVSVNTSRSSHNQHQNQRPPALSKPVTLVHKTERGLIRLQCISIPVRRPPQVSNSSVISSDNEPASVTTPVSVSVSPVTQGDPVPSLVPSSAAVITDMGTSPASVTVATPACVSLQHQTQSQAAPLAGIITNNNSSSTSVTSNSNSNNKIRLSDVMEPELHQICLRIQHLEHRVSDMIVNNPNGCCIYFGRFDENLCSTGPEPIEPQIQQFVADCNRYCVDMLLENMQRGVVLTILNGSIYAEKLCKCATFVYRPGNNGEFYFVDKLNRRDKMMIFDFRSFLEELHYYQRGVGHKPHVELILAFGQQIKENSSPESLYVWCRLASCKAWFLLQRTLSNQSKPTVLSNSNSNGTGGTGGSGKNNSIGVTNISGTKKSSSHIGIISNISNGNIIKLNPHPQPHPHHPHHHPQSLPVSVSVPISAVSQSHHQSHHQYQYQYSAHQYHTHNSQTHTHTYSHSHHRNRHGNGNSRQNSQVSPNGHSSHHIRHSHTHSHSHGHGHSHSHSHDHSDGGECDRDPMDVSDDMADSDIGMGGVGTGQHSHRQRHGHGHGHNNSDSCDDNTDSENGMEERTGGGRLMRGERYEHELKREQMDDEEEERDGEEQDEEEEEAVPEDLIEIDHMVYAADSCLPDELGIGVGHEVSIEPAPEEFPSIHFHASYGSRTSRFDENDFSFQFDSSSGY